MAGGGAAAGARAAATGLAATLEAAAAALVGVYCERQAAALLEATRRLALATPAAPPLLGVGSGGGDYLTDVSAAPPHRGVFKGFLEDSGLRPWAERSVLASTANNPRHVAPRYLTAADHPGSDDVAFYDSDQRPHQASQRHYALDSNNRLGSGLSPSSVKAALRLSDVSPSHSRRQAAVSRAVDDSQREKASEQQLADGGTAVVPLTVAAAGATALADASRRAVDSIAQLRS